ncbi:MAG: VCBS repeat-containing protein [Bacteroidota bacterium]
MGCSDDSEKKETTITPEDQKIFVERTAEETGIHFENKITSTPELNILNYIYFYNGAGVATADFNNDGLNDLYFTANQTEDRLYLNEGDLSFRDVTEASKIQNTGNWTTGVTTVDINSDGLMDLYISKMGDYPSITGHNLLYINEGPNEMGLPTFKEDAASYQLDFKGLSTQAAFFDYDRDGDLDLFLLNHSTNPNQNYGRGTVRNTPNYESGDKLFENRNGTFVNISEEAGILESKIGYGLGVAISDINNDGWPDIYVGNDFFENDYLYINQGDKTFVEAITTKSGAIGHTTHFSMGNDVADLNNDGWTDIVSVDMLPEDLQTYKTSGSEFNYQIYNNYLNNGYTRQFMQNTLQLNNGHGVFSEIGYLSGIAATEWSWSPLIADFDNDGLQDLYVTNGILGATNDMDFISFIANEEIQKNLGSDMDEQDMNFIDRIPVKKTRNYLFSNEDDAQFRDRSTEWIAAEASFSNGAVYSDLDNDGDLDLVVNNVNEPASVFENTQSKNNSLRVQLKGGAKNTQGIGARVIAFSNGQQMLRENFTTRGYLSAVAPELYFGLGTDQMADSVMVTWPDGAFQTVRQVAANTTLVLSRSEANTEHDGIITDSTNQYLIESPALFNFKHRENTTIEFNRNPLIAFALSNEGPDVSVADINNDGLDDVFIGGAKGQASQLLVQQTDGTFTSQQPELFEADAINEDVAHVLTDLDDDGYIDLLVVSGGNEFTHGSPIAPRAYFNQNGVFKKKADFIGLDWPINASAITIFDPDGDGDKDVFVSSNTPSALDGNRTSQLVLQQVDKGSFLISQKLTGPQILNGSGCNKMVVADLDGDGVAELITVGDWTPISVYAKIKDQFVLRRDNGLSETYGWWNTLVADDFDKDGDIDLVVGNWGLNSRLTASREQPLKRYLKDFDANGSEETLITYFYHGVETPFVSKDELVKQLPGINKKYLSYANFASASLEEIFGKEALNSATVDTVYDLGSCYFENDGVGNFKKHLLPLPAQVSSVNDIHIEDFNKDGYSDLLLVGNNFEISPQLSSLDASHGVLLLNDRQGGFEEAKGQKFNVSGAARNIEKIHYRDHDYLIITRNNDHPLFFKLNQ